MYLACPLQVNQGEIPSLYMRVLSRRQYQEFYLSSQSSTAGKFRPAFRCHYI